MGKFTDLVGRRFTRLLVLRRVTELNVDPVKWECRCNCGKTIITAGHLLRKGETLSCGCLRMERVLSKITTHGMSGKSEYKIWAGMRARCNNPKNPQYKNYGGRGINVCSRWMESFVNFYKDMGPRPSLSYSLERIDNEKGYSPNNCKWATQKEQSRNRRTNRFVIFHGVRTMVSDVAKKLNLPLTIVLYHLNKGVHPDEIIKHLVNEMLYDFEGSTYSTKELSEKTGIQYKTMLRRLKMFNTVEEAVYYHGRKRKPKGV